MDPRARRSRAALADAVYRLAAERDIESISVTEITAAAGVSRDTFYRHADDPVDLLARSLHEELAGALGVFRELPAGSGSGESVFAAPARVLIGHVRDHAAVYRQAPGGRLSGRLRQVLLDVSADILARHLKRHPGIAPEDIDLEDPAVFAMTVSYAAGGTVAAVEAWLAGGMVLPVDDAVAVMLAAAPRWWLGVAGSGPGSVSGGGAGAGALRPGRTRAPE
ncbi:TetR family transcriptional regulator [Nakamurella sp. YIM 132087]|uniref:TetR family transcriptional regulator n=1 Tax=Nakamurella alba TaxID=2665158 RepID=A0A7K1FQL8_9ACTN|nr:TetR/AcrR family transcriptional regulator [Nakamurella alba]MTD16436.1 TetR family transcriptional regulator [Nakamurella alba]